MTIRERTMSNSNSYGQQEKSQPSRRDRKKAKKSTYSDYIKQEMSELIEKIDLDDLQKRFMKARWLDQLLWLEGRATKSRNRYYNLRLLTIIGGVIVPALVSVTSVNTQDKDTTLRDIFGWTAFGLSQIVAISAAVEELFHYGESYRRYRNSAEGMKIEGWQFFQLSGPYSIAKDHNEAYPIFAANVETIIQKDVEGYVSQTAQTDAQIQAKMDAKIDRNIALANQQLREQLQRPPTPVTPTQDTPTFAGRPQFGDTIPAPSGSPFGSAPITFGSATTNGSAIGEEEGEDEFITPNQLQNSSFGATDSPSGFAPTGASLNSAPPNLSSIPTFADEEEDEFVTPAQMSGIPSITTPNNFAAPPVSIQPAPPPPAPPKPVEPPAPPPLTTPEIVADILECPLKQTQTYLPGVLAALQERNLLDKPTLIATIATIGVETGGFQPIPEYGGNSYFTEMYEGRDDLGNTQPGDGARYHGRGFVQITGRANYRHYSQQLGLGTSLEDNPDLALDAKVGAQILACYFDECGVAQAARNNDWRKVRRLVNGGYNGWDEFDHFVQRALSRI